MNGTYLRLEIVRALRNRRVLILTVALPALLLLIFGASGGRDATIGGVSVAAYTMVSMAIFGAMTAAIGTGGQIAVERGLGWNRQLRLTQLSPGRYVVSKTLLSLLLALPALVVTYLVGAVGLHVHLAPATWLLVFAASWLGALPFAALGVLIGYLARPESVQPVSALISLSLAAFGGLWGPVETMPSVLRTIAHFTPAYWVGQVARSPLGSFHNGLNLSAVAVLLAWAVGLGGLALVRFRVDTARA